MCIQFKWGFQFVLLETPIGVSTRFKPVEIQIGIFPTRIVSNPPGF